MHRYINVIYIYTGYNLQKFNNREKETAVITLAMDWNICKIF